MDVKPWLIVVLISPLQTHVLAIARVKAARDFNFSKAWVGGPHSGCKMPEGKTILVFILDMFCLCTDALLFVGPIDIDDS